MLDLNSWDPLQRECLTDWFTSDLNLVLARVGEDTELLLVDVSAQISPNVAP